MTDKQPNWNARYTAVPKRTWLVTVLLRHPHFNDTGFDTEVLDSDQLVDAYTLSQAKQIARQTLTPPNVDPALLSFRFEELIEN